MYQCRVSVTTTRGVRVGGRVCYSFGGTIQAAIYVGFDAVQKSKPVHIQAVSQEAAGKLQCISGVVDHLTNLVDKVGDTVGSERRLLSSSAAVECIASLGVAPDDATPSALSDPNSQLLRQLRAAHNAYMEEVMQSVLESVSLLQHVFMRSDLGAVGADGKLTDHVGHDVAARLGFNMDESRDRFELALREMSKVHFCVTVKRKMTFQAGIKVTSGLFRHGDLMDIFDPSGKLSAFSSTAEIDIPSVPIVQVYTGIDMGFKLPFYFQADCGRVPIQSASRELSVFWHSGRQSWVADL